MLANFGTEPHRRRSPGLTPAAALCTAPWQSPPCVQLTPRRRKLPGSAPEQPNPSLLRLRVDTPLKDSPCCHHMLQHRSRMRMFLLLLCKTKKQKKKHSCFLYKWAVFGPETLFLTIPPLCVSGGGGGGVEGGQPALPRLSALQSVMLCC